MRTNRRRLAATMIVALCGLAAWAGADATPKKRMWAKSFLGQPAPAFSVQKWATAEPAREGKFILLDFWATWCPPCRKAVDELNDLHAKFGDRLVVIGISDEDVETVQEFTKKKIKYFSAVDEEAALKKKYEVSGVPHVVIINPVGTVVWEGFPFLPGHELTEAVVADLLKAGGGNAPAP